MRKILMLLLGVFVICSQLFAQNRTITGTITDAQGNGVPNVSVAVKGTSIGTTTSGNGNFTLSVPANARTLVVSSVGFATQEVAIGSSNVLSISLVSSEQELGEVVVTVPYGTIKKTAFTGSEATVTAKTLEKQQVTSVTRALEGLIPGIITTNGGGAPGTNAGIIVRGVGSVNASSAPLYVVNGVPYDGSIAALSMDEIESVTVLKDAAASALYGSRAANGVIMITTKRGRRGAPSVSATVRQGYMDRAIPEYDRVGPIEYYELMWEGIRNDYYYGQGQTLAQAGVTASNQVAGPNGLVYNPFSVPRNQVINPTTGKLNPNAQLLWNDSWEDALYRTAGRQNVNLSISGAGDKSDYFISAGYLNEDGIVINSGYKRYNTRLNLNTQATKWLKAGLNLDGAIANQNNLLSTGTFTSNPFYYSRAMGPIYPVYRRDTLTGQTIIDPATGGPALDWGRPDMMGARPYAPNSNLVGSLNLDDRHNKIFNGNANTYFEISFLKNFAFKTTLGVNYYNRYGTTYQNNQFGDADNVRGRSTKTSDRQVSLTLNEVLSWNKAFGRHNVRALIGHENYRYQFNTASATSTGFPFPGTTELDNASTLEGIGSSEDHHRIEGYFTGVNYDYDNRYLFSATFRRDGTSRFFADNRWGNFYSVGLGWRVSQEEFMRNISWINELKFKASYGEQGNESIGSYYAWQNLYAMGWNNANFSGGIVGGLPNPDLVWEGNEALNIGLDFALLRNRLQGTIEYFNRVSDNLLFDVPLPVSTGNADITRNVGTMSNSGVELQLGYNAIRGRDFDYRIDINLTKFRNKMVKLPLEDMPVSGTKKLTLGRSIFDFYIREFAGVDASTGKALYYRDVLGADGKPTGQRVLTDSFSKATQYFMGASSLPDISGGITNSFRYKGFDLSFLVTFAYGGSFYDGNYASLMHRGDFGTAWHADILNRWQKPGDVTNVPKIQSTVADNNGVSSRFLFDASWLNIKNITLSYSLPKTLFNRVGIAGIQVFGNIDNAWLFTNHKGMDPQRSFNGTSDFSFTPYRTITFGATVNL